MVLIAVQLLRVKGAIWILFVQFYGCDTKKFRTNDSIKLIEYTFSNFELVNIQDLIEQEFTAWKSLNLGNIEIVKGTQNSFSVTYEPLEHPVMAISKDLIQNLEVIINVPDTFMAPILENSTIGYLEVVSGDTVICSSNILTTQTIDKKNINNYLLEFFSNYSSALNSITHF